MSKKYSYEEITKETMLIYAYKHHQDWINIARKYVGEYYAEDIVQEFYLRLYEKARLKDFVFTDLTVNKSYAFLLIRSLAIDLQREKARSGKMYLEDIDYTSEDFKVKKRVKSLEELEAYNKISLKIDAIIKDWHWYDKELFNIYRFTDLSIRGIAKETTISWVSIFNTLKRCKEIIKEELGEDYEDYLNEDYEHLK
jgi:RNA polymerase sigma factor (sigma-70 family)